MYAGFQVSLQGAILREPPITKCTAIFLDFEMDCPIVNFKSIFVVTASKYFLAYWTHDLV